MNKRRIIDQGIIFLSISILFSVWAWIMFTRPIVMSFLVVAAVFCMFFIASGQIYKVYKDRLPWRKNDGKYQE